MALLLRSRCTLVGQKAAPQCSAAPATRCKEFLPASKACPLGPARRQSSPLRYSLVRATNSNNPSEMTPAFDLVNWLECRVHSGESRVG